MIVSSASAALGTGGGSWSGGGVLVASTPVGSLWLRELPRRLALPTVRGVTLVLTVLGTGLQWLQLQRRRLRGL